jgi:hypothetical protein
MFSHEQYTPGRQAEGKQARALWADVSLDPEQTNGKRVRGLILRARRDLFKEAIEELPLQYRDIDLAKKSKSCHTKLLLRLPTLF